MFRSGLLISTAMTAVTLLCSPTLHAASVQTDMHVAGRDPNTRFLCTYGQFRVSAYSGDPASSEYSVRWTHVAVPIRGHGRTVTSITVIEAASGYTYSPAFSAGIYSNTPSGFPGKLIAGGRAQAGASCGQVKIAIPSTVLQPKTRYWIEETTQAPSKYGTNALYWIVNPNTRHKAYVQSYHFSYSEGSKISPWTEQSNGPYLKLK